MPSKKWVAVHNGSQIRVANAWTGRAKVYIDGDCRDTNNSVFASSKSVALSARITIASGAPFLVEVFIKAMMIVKAKICVNGVQVGGDVF